MPTWRGTQADRARKLLERRALVRPRELEQLGVSRTALCRLVEAGEVERVGRGLYRLAARAPSEYVGLVEVAQRAPKAVICLLSALSFHEIGTQLPHRVWILIGDKAWKPRIAWPPLEVVRCDPRNLDAGVEVHTFDGVPVRVTGAARTVADCFKYRGRVGLDVAIEALREGWRDRLFSIAALLEAARRNRVERVLRPYLEAIV